MKKYPLLLKPVIKDYLWGGKRLKDDFGFETEKEIAAEGWMLACHKDGTNTIINGEFAGKSFDEALKLWGYEEKFPILIKLIDAKQKLSVQVHPDNEYALKNEGEFGKTEMWYVVDCLEGAQLAYGFKRNIGKSEFRERIENNTLDEVINYVPIKQGDVFFIEAGTLHAIGEGILIAEIQQNSNSTYRVSDYGRLGADGKPRELHIDKAIDVTETVIPTIPYGKTGKETSLSFGKCRELGVCEYFKTYKIDLDGEIKIENETSSVLVLDGKINIKYQDEELTLKKGDCVFIPNECDTLIEGSGEIIYTIM